MRESRTFQFLNVMRFVSAGWVVLSHVGGPPLYTLFSGHVAEIVRKAMIAPFAGVAAVMVFFVISGFCIHHPYITGKRFQIAPFYAQRFVRIGLPLLAAVAVHAWWNTTGWLKNVLWSVYCEMVYYAAYPLLRLLMARFSAKAVLIASFVVSWLFCLIPDTGYGHIIAYGNGWTWLVCLPVWLCGCLLAEWFKDGAVVPDLAERISARVRNHLTLARWSVWVLSSVLLVLGIEELLPFKYTLPVFGVVVLLWFLAEMRLSEADSWIARLGMAGYSIYLIHPIARPIRDSFFLAGHPMLAWLVRLAIVAGASALFYYVVENPSHRIARRVGKALDRKPRLNSGCGSGLAGSAESSVQS